MTTLALRGLKKIILIGSGVCYVGKRGELKLSFIHVECNICVYTIIYILGQKFRLLFKELEKLVAPA